MKKNESPCLTSGMPIHFDDLLVKAAIAATPKSVGDFVNNPVTFRQKVSYLKIFGVTDLMARCADKLGVRKYAAEVLGEDICVPVLAEYDSPDEIDLDILPDRFVLKCNHGSQFNILVNDKSKFNLENSRSVLRKWLSEDYSLVFGELQYHPVVPICFAEKFIDAHECGVFDCKFSCFNGKPEYCEYRQAGSHRETTHRDMAGNVVNRHFRGWGSSSPDPIPLWFDEMKQYATVLSQAFDFVRVDFILGRDRFYLGELTFCPGAAMEEYDNGITDLYLGSLLRISTPPVRREDVKVIPDKGRFKDICYAIDGNYDQGRLLLISLFSLVKSARDPSVFRIHILTDHGGRSSLAEGMADRIEDLAGKGGVCSVDFTDCGDWIDLNLGRLRSVKNCVMANWLRLSIPWTVSSERCLYLDNDTVVLRDPGDIFDEDMDGAWIGVSENAYVETYFDLSKGFTKEGIYCPPGNHRHFPQCGVMLVDKSAALRSGFVERIRSDGLFAAERIDGVTRNEPVLYRCLAPEEIHWLPKKYNREANVWLAKGESGDRWQPFDSIADAVVVHMNGGRHKSGKCAEYVSRLWDEYERFVSDRHGVSLVKSEGQIDWSRYVDAVYLIHFTGDSHRERLPNILSELSRVGILESDVRIKYTANSRWHDAAVEKFKAEHPGWDLPGWWADVGMTTFDILTEALATGFESIAVFETDCVFIKDTDLLKRYLDTIPENAGIAKLEWFKVPGDAAQVAPRAEAGSAEYWEPSPTRTSGAACYIIRRKGMDELLRVLRDFCPGPSDFAMNFCNTDIYVSKDHAAVQRAYPSSKTGGCNAYGNMDLSRYNLPEGYDHSTGECRTVKNHVSGHRPVPAEVVSLPSFPVPDNRVVDCFKTLSDLMRKHHDYREPSCLMARLLHEVSPVGNQGVIRTMIEQGLRTTVKKPGLPVDDWCWNGGPEKLLSQLNSPPGSPGSEQYIVM